MLLVVLVQSHRLVDLTEQIHGLSTYIKETPQVHIYSLWVSVMKYYFYPLVSFQIVLMSLLMLKGSLMKEMVCVYYIYVPMSACMIPVIHRGHI